ncbi:MAG: dihydrolipoamide acetyltransferase family protein [Bacillus sp. (in: firmicutes)]
MSTSIVMPKLGMTMKEGTVVEWLKKPGDAIIAGEGVATISSDKLTSEVEAPASGVLLEIIEDMDAEVEVGKVIGIIGEAGEKAKPVSAIEPVNPTPYKENKVIESKEDVEKHPNRQIRISPAARKKAKELGVETLQVTGTGPKGRITRRDIELYAKERDQHPTAPVESNQLEQRKKIETAPMKAEERTVNTAATIEKLPPIRSVIAKRMHESISATAQLTLHRKAEINKLIEFQKQVRNEASNSDIPIKLTLTVLIARAVTLSLRDKPFMNTHLIDNKLYKYEEVHLGIAAALANGLVVPVVKHAEQLPLGELAKAISHIIEKAKSGKADSSELTGSTFTITNLGAQGIEYFTPILNTPETGILGVGTFIEELKLEDEQVITIKKLPLSLTFDHRVLDGAPAAEFLGRVIYYLEHPYLLVL